MRKALNAISEICFILLAARMSLTLEVNAINTSVFFCLSWCKACNQSLGFIAQYNTNLFPKAKSNNRYDICKKHENKQNEAIFIIMNSNQL